MQYTLIVYGSAVLVSIILIIEEHKPKWGASADYDAQGIIGSLLGSLHAIRTVELVDRIEKRNK